MALLFCFLSLLLSLNAHKNHSFGLPRYASIIETKPLKTHSHKPRALVLWMIKPKKSYPLDSADQYTCPDETRGDHFSGKTRVSLVDTARKRVINTITIKREPDYDGQEVPDSFDIPYRIRAGYYYHVAGTDEGRPTILNLKDYNGDGQALEFALYDAPACMPLYTTLIGYSATTDRVINYPIALDVTKENGEAEHEISRWLDYLFIREPTKPGHWHYEIDYRGRGGTLNQYEITYHPRREEFVGKVLWSTNAPEK